MKTNSLWHYSVWLVAIRFLLPLAIVILLELTGINLVNVGIPYISAILAATIAGCRAARVLERMPDLRSLLGFACGATLIFFIVNAAAYFILAISLIGPVQMLDLIEWHYGGHMANLMLSLTVFAFVANSLLFWLAAKVELRAMTRRRYKEQAL